MLLIYKGIEIRKSIAVILIVEKMGSLDNMGDHIKSFWIHCQLANELP